MHTNEWRHSVASRAAVRPARLGRWLQRAALALLALGAGSAALAEGSRTLMPAGYTGGRASLNVKNTGLYATVARERQFLYVYAEAGEYILVATSNRATVSGTVGNGDVLVYAPPPGGFGTRGDETRPAVAALTCSSATPPANSFTGAGRGIIASRAAELAGPNSADGTVTVPGGYNPCAYRVPTTGIYGVQFTGTVDPVGVTGDVGGDINTWQLARNHVLSWDVTVRADATSITDLNARVFSYAWVIFNNTNIRTTLYYATADGYRYEQIMRGINPGAAVFYGNRAGFLDNGQPLYHDVRGTNQPVNTGIPAGVVPQAPQSPIFFSSIGAAAPHVAQAEKTLGALGVPLVPPTPQLTSPTFLGNINNNRSTVGAGGVFQFNTVNTLTYEIVISRGVDFDPANPLNRTLTGTALSGGHSVAWDGNDNNGVPFPASATDYTYRISGRNGEIHFPIIDIEGNASGGPTLRKLNGSGGTTVYFDDRGYITRNGIAVGARNGHLCGLNHLQVQPTPTHSLTGIDSNAQDGSSRYYRYWAGSSDPNTDCSNAANVYFGSAKALDLWALEKTQEFNLPLTVEPPQPNPDVGTVVTATATALPGETVFGTLSFSNNGGTQATGVAYTFAVGTPGSCPTGFNFTLLPAGVTFTYSASTCAVTFTGMPATLAAAADLNFNFQYTAPATGTVTATATVAATQDPLPGTGSPNTSSAPTVVQVADLAISKTASTPVLLTGPVTFTLRAWNNGPRPVSGALVTDEVPASITGVTWTCTAVGNAACGSASGAGNTVSLTANLGVDTGAASTADTDYVQIVVTGTATSLGALSNTAGIAVPSGTSDPTPGNNASTSSSNVVEGADLSLAKSDGGNPVVVGQTVTYTLAASNAGPSTATTVSVSDTIPAGLTFISAAGTGWACNFAAGTVTCTRATLAVGAAPVITLQLGVPASYAGANPISNSASITSATLDPTPGNNTGSDTTPVQVPPDAVNDGPATTPFGQAITTPVLGNDIPGTAPLNPASVTITTPSPNGTAVVNGDGSITFTPAAGFAGTTTYTYQVCDTSVPTPLCDSATVTIVVGPQANDDSTTVAAGGTATGSVTGNDTAPAGSTYSVVTPPPGGGLTFNPNGSYSYTPPAGTSGPVTFTYQVCLPAPNQTVCDDATVTIVVGPQANDDTQTVPFGGTATGSVTGNDTAPVGSTYSIVTPPPGGGLTFNPNGSYSYTPPAGTSGPVTFTYQVCLPAPNQAVCDEATVTIVVGPQADDDSASTPQNSLLSASVAGNDVAPANATFAVITPPPSGTLVLDPNTGGYTYQPAPGFTGEIEFTYQVCLAAPNGTVCDPATVTITVGANSIDAQPDTDSTAQNTPVTTVVLQNDVVGANGAALDPASVTILTPSPNGTATPNPDGTVTFTPNANFSGTTTYTYQVCDTSSPTPVCASAQVTVVVDPNVVVANPDGDSTAQNTPVTTNVIGNDSVLPNGAPLVPGSITIVSSPNGTATPNGDGSITFTPAANFSGTATYTYQVCDASVPTPVCAQTTVQVLVGNNLVGAVDDNESTPQNTPVTTNVIGNDTTTGAPLNPASVTVTVPSPNGTTTVTPDGTITFDPAPNFSGTTTYTYQVCDTSTPTPVCDTAVVTVTVAPNIVSALNDDDSTPQNTPVTTIVLANDGVLPDGAPLDPGSVTVTVPSPNGTTLVNPDGSIQFTPAPGFSGTTTYTYEVCDTSTPEPVCDVAVVTITVGVNSIDAQDDTDSTPQNMPVTTDVLGNDSSTGAALDPSSVTIVAQSDDGNAFVNPDGSITFTPDPGFSGTTTYTYQVCDLSTPTPVCAAALVTIVVDANTIAAVNDGDSTPQNTPVVTNVVGNDTTSPTGAPLDPGSVSIVSQPANGSAVANPDGTVTFTPDANFSGVTSYVYQVCDTSTPTPVCDSATVEITVAPNVVSPLNDNASTPQNTPVTTDVLGNDSVLPNGAPIDPGSVSITSPSPNGTATPNPDGTITFEPNPGFSGTTSYTYEVCDLSVPTPVCATAVVSVTVGNNTLELDNDADITPQNTDVTTNVLSNDGSNGAPLNPASVTIFVQSPDGVATANADGTVTFVPDENFSGVTSYTYRVCDTSTPTPVCATAVVTITVEPNLVTAVDESTVTAQNTPVTTPVLGNDTVLPNGAPLDPTSVTVTVPSPNGSTTVNANGSITFQPNPGFSGTTTYTYEVCDLSVPTPVCDQATVTVVIGDNQVAAADDNDSTPQNTPVTTNVIGNDSSTGAALDPASVAVTVQSPNGSAVANANGTITFTPNPGFSGTTTYSYRVCDTSTPTPICDTAVVTIVVAPNDVTAVDDNDTTAQNMPVTTPVLGNDSTTGAALDPASVTVTVQSPNGTATPNADGTITFTPTPGFSGTTTYTYRVCDTSTPAPLCDTAVVTIVIAPNDINANNDADNTPQNTPVTTSVLGNDTVTGAPLDPASVVVTTPSPNGTTTVNPDGTITFTPSPNFSGVTTYSYQVCDTSTPTPLCDIAIVTITVGASSVTANDNFDATTQNTPVTTNVIGNDSSTGAPLDPASIVIIAASPDGTAVPNADGTITFTPNPGFSGVTTYSYQVCDTSTPTPVCDTALVTITIPPNAVSALNDNDSTPQNTPVTVPVLGNDTTTSLPLDPASVVVTVQSPDGSTVVNPDGSITFTPNPGFSGVTTFTYEVCDTSSPTPVCDTAIVTITVGTSTVTAVDDNDTTPQNTPVTTIVLGNDSSTGAPLDPGSVAIVAPSADGTAVVNPDGSITFTPNPGFSGTTTYTYSVCDTSNPTPQCDTALVTIVVGAGAVTAVDDNDSTPQNTPVTTPVIGNDSSTGPALDPGSVTIVVPSPDGNLVVNPDGSITFTPNPGFSGTTTYTYRVCDTSTPTPVCDTAVVTIVVGSGTVNAVNDNATTPQETPVTIAVLGNDSSAGQPLDPSSVTVTVPSPNGSTVVNPDGSITFTPSPGFSGTTMFTYRVCDTSTPTPVCDTAIVTVVVPPPGALSADLTVLKTGPANADAGDQIVFTIEVENLGPDAARAVVLSDPTPAGLQFVANTGDCTTAFPCSLGDLAVGDTRTVQATFLVPANYRGPSTITNIASVTSATPDPTPGDTSSSASTIVQGGVGPVPVPQPTRIPADGRWAMLLLGLATVLIAGLRLRRG